MAGKKDALKNVFLDKLRSHQSLESNDGTHKCKVWSRGVKITRYSTPFQHVVAYYARLHNFISKKEHQ